MASSRFVAFLLTCASLALAQTSALTAPTVIFGLQPQRPPVARVNQTWSWSLLPNTFQTATSDSLTYTVDRLPEWAQFDPATLSFTGLPRRHDVANTTVYVTAQSTGDLGSVTDSFGLLVERGPGPTIRYPVAQQLPNATTLPEGRVLEYNGAVVVPPRWSFSIGLQWDTFALADGDFAYYTAYQEGYTSLPEWVTFDPASVTFDGVSPYNGSIDIVVYGSNHWGYGDVWQRFSIEVDRHTFDLTRELPPLNTSLGANVDYEITLANLVIDQAPAAPADITVSPDLSSLPFLSYNPSNRQISGRVPTAASSVNSTIIPVTFNNTLGNSLVANLTFSVVGAVAAEGLLTTSVIPALLVAPGQSFTSNLAQYATEADATYSASFMPTAAGQWLSFNASSLLLAGTAPSPAPTYGNVTVTLSARERSSGAMQNATLPIAFSALTTNLNSNEGDEGGLSKTGKIALAAVFGGLGGLALLILLSICCRRRRAAQRQEEEVDDRRVLTQDVSPYIGGYNEEKEGRSWGGTPNLDVEAPAAKAKRMDLMRVFNKGAKSPSQMTGLGIDSPVPDNGHVVVVTDAEQGATYRPDSEAGSIMLDDSSWGSRSTRSMFYSDNELATSRSVPRQRRDFMINPPPFEPQLPPPVQISPSPTRAVFGETSRMISSPSLGSPSISDTRRSSSGLLNEGTIATASLHEVEAGSTVRPRLIPFTSERTVVRTPPATQSYPSPSQPVRYGGFEAEDEDWRMADARFSVQSAPYLPPDGPQTASPIFYSPMTVTPVATPLLGQGEMPNPGLRLVGPSSPTRRHERTQTMSSDKTITHEQQRVTIGVGEPIHFTPALNPPPTASIGSPGRHGPTRKAYMALTDYPEDGTRDRRPLPDWLHFETRELEFWGIPRMADIGDHHVQVVERRAAPGSPKRRTMEDGPTAPRVEQDETEQVVGRVVLSVVDKRASAEYGHGATSSVQVVRF